MAGTSCATLGPAPAPQNSTNQQAKLNKTSIVRLEREQISSDYPMAREHSRAFELVQAQTLLEKRTFVRSR